MKQRIQEERLKEKGSSISLNVACPLLFAIKIPSMNPLQQKLLSKSSFMAGLDCPRKLWQRLWDRSSAAPFGGMSQLIMEMGTRFGVLAHQLPAGASLVDVDFRNLDQALLDTQAAIASGASTILELCFVHDHFRVVSDVVERQADGSWHLTEVKSSISVNPL